MAVRYRFCNESYVYEDVWVSFSEGTCVKVESWQQGQSSYERWAKPCTFSIPTPINHDLIITYNYRYEVVSDNPGDSGTFTVTNYTVIPEGEISKVIQQDCLIEIVDDLGAGGIEYTTWTLENIWLQRQQELPECGEPVSCDLAISDYTSTATSKRGEEDGEIEVTITGNTGSTQVWYINGEPTYTGGTTQSFTGLTAGQYTILITEEDCTAQQNIWVIDGDFRTGDFNYSTPSQLTAAYNPIIYNVATHVNSVIERKSQVVFEVEDETIPDGFQIKVSTTKPFIYEQSFYARGFPNRNNFFLATAVTDINDNVIGGNTREEIVESIAEVFQNDIVISQNYDIQVQGYEIYLTAKQSGSKYDLQLNDNIYIRNAAGDNVTTGITLTTIENGTDLYDGGIIDNYSVYAELYLSEDDTIQYPNPGDLMSYKKISEMSLPFQTNNQHRFDLSPILQSYVFSSKPFYEFEGFIILPQMLRPYYLKLGETYPIVSNSNTIKKRFKSQSEVRYVINSALDYFNANDMSDYLGEPVSNLNPAFRITKQIWSNNLFITNPTLGTVTNLQYSVWNRNNTSIVKNWQNSNMFSNLTHSRFYWIRISGETGGVAFTVQRRYYISSIGSGAYDNSQGLTIIPMVNINYLTNSPAIKQIQRQQNEYLYFILIQNYGYPISCEGDIYYYDGTTDSGQTFFDITTGTTNTGGVFMLNLSYDKLGLEDYEFSGSTVRRIKYVDVRIMYDDSGTKKQLTVDKRYMFNINEQPRKFGILFENKLGTYDTIDMIGVIERQFDREYGEYTVLTTPTNQGAYRQGFKNKAVYNTRITKQITCNTGWLNKEHLNWLKELLNSNNIYDYTEDNQHYLKLINHKYIESSQEDLFDMEVTFEYTLYENNTNV